LIGSAKIGECSLTTKKNTVFCQLERNIAETLSQCYICGMSNAVVMSAVSPWESAETDILTDSHQSCSLIVWNDEVNTFEWVIQTLIEVCDHTEQQAEQCALFIHHKGKYAVKQGEFDTMKQMCSAITERGIGATVEMNAHSC